MIPFPFRTYRRPHTCRRGERQAMEKGVSPEATLSLGLSQARRVSRLCVRGDGAGRVRAREESARGGAHAREAVSKRGARPAPAGERGVDACAVRAPGSMHIEWNGPRSSVLKPVGFPPVRPSSAVRRGVVMRRRCVARTRPSNLPCSLTRTRFCLEYAVWCSSCHGVALQPPDSAFEQAALDDRVGVVHEVRKLLLRV